MIVSTTVASSSTDKALRRRASGDILALLGLRARIDRDKRLAEGAFREDSAEEIGNICAVANASPIGPAPIMFEIARSRSNPARG